MKTIPQQLRVAVCALSLAALQLPASAIITAGASENQEDEETLQVTATEVFGARPKFPFFNNLGVIDFSSGIYMGNGFVLTAAHVGAKPFKLHDGSVYEPAPGSEWHVRNPDGTLSDLLVFRVLYAPNDSLAQLPEVPIGPVPPPRGSKVLILGAGASAIAEDESFKWDHRYAPRWGVNRVEHLYQKKIHSAGFVTPGFSIQFDEGPNQCQAAPGDSGGAAFVFNQTTNRWELGGVILAIDGSPGTVTFGDQTYLGSLQAIPKNAFARPLIANLRPVQPEP